MAIARVNRPAVVVYGGTIRAGCRPNKDEKLDIISAFQAYGEYITGKVDDASKRPRTAAALLTFCRFASSSSSSR